MSLFTVRLVYFYGAQDYTQSHYTSKLYFQAVKGGLLHTFFLYNKFDYHLEHFAFILFSAIWFNDT